MSVTWGEPDSGWGGIWSLGGERGIERESSRTAEGIVEGSWMIFEVDNIEGREDEQQGRGQNQKEEMVKYCCQIQPPHLGPACHFHPSPPKTLGLSQSFPPISPPVLAAPKRFENQSVLNFRCSFCCELSFSPNAEHFSPLAGTLV